LPVAPEALYHAAFRSPEGTYCLVAGQQGLLRVYDLANSREVRDLGPPKSTGAAPTIGRAVWSSSMSTVAWQPHGKPDVMVHTGEGSPAARALAAAAGMVPLGVSPGGKLLGCGTTGGNAVVFDTSDGRELLRFSAGAGDLLAVTFLDERRLLSAGEDGAVRLWDLEGGKELMEDAGHTAPVLALNFSGDGRRLASSGRDGTVRVWDVESGRSLADFRGGQGAVGHVGLSPDGRRAVSATSSGVRVWDVEGRVSLRDIPQPSAAHLTVTPDGREFAYIATHSSNAVVFQSLGLPAGGQVVADNARTTCLALSPDGNGLLTGLSAFGMVLWDVAERRELRRYGGHLADLRAVSFTPDRGRFLSLSATWAGPGDRVLYHWDRDEELPRTRLPLEGLPDTAMQFAFSRQARLLAGVSADARVFVWDTETGRRRVEWRLPGVADAVAIDPAERHLASANRNGTVYYFKLPPPPAER
jgi:WD40 repeat protein